jgi:hypothetical protein
MPTQQLPIKAQGLPNNPEPLRNKKKYIKHILETILG